MVNFEASYLAVRARVPALDQQESNSLDGELTKKTIVAYKSAVK